MSKMDEHVECSCQSWLGDFTQWFSWWPPFMRALEYLNNYFLLAGRREVSYVSVVNKLNHYYKEAIWLVGIFFNSFNTFSIQIIMGWLDAQLVSSVLALFSPLNTHGANQMCYPIWKWWWIGFNDSHTKYYFLKKPSWQTGPKKISSLCFYIFYYFTKVENEHKT